MHHLLYIKMGDALDAGRVGVGNERAEDQLVDLFTTSLGMQELKHANVFLKVV